MSKLSYEWKDICVELMKSVHGFDDFKNNNELKCKDFVKKDEKTNLLRVIENNYNQSKIDLNIVTKTQEEIKSEIYDQAIFLADDITEASIKHINEDPNLSVILENGKFFSNFEILTSIYGLCKEQCEYICGFYPENKNQCRAAKNKKEKCLVYRISNDADFHSSMGWTNLLYSDLNNLIKNRIKIKKESMN